MDSIPRLGFTSSLFLLLLLHTLFPFSISSKPQRLLLQSSSRSPQNLQTFPSTAIPAFTNPLPPPPPPPSPPTSTPSDSDNGNIAAAVIGTAASSFALYGFLFFAFYRFTKKKRRDPETRVNNSDLAAAAAAAGGGANTFRSKRERTIKGVIVDDNGLDVLYWRNLEDTARRRCDHCNSIVDKSRHADNEEATGSPEPRRRRRVKGGMMTQETPLLPIDSVSSSSPAFAQSSATNRNSSVSIASLEAVSSPSAAQPAKSQPPPPPPPPPPPARKTPPPPPPPRRRAVAPPKGPDGGSERPRLKPLHWEKVTPTRAGHSMVWDRINDGSIKFDDEQMEALFGYVSSIQNPPKPNSGESSSSTPTSAASPAAAPSQISLLDARKSQNIAIILRTLAASRREILESLRRGHGLAADTLDKLSRIALTKDEESLILSFSGDPIHLTAAESFLFHLLRTFPSAFPRIRAMHFRRRVYDPEIPHLRQSLQTLELACKELRTRGLFLKLLEAILKAGNRMNAGTARGDAQAFDLAALRKLSDVKSTDGKTTLLHFVVEEVVRSEGKRFAAMNATSPEALEQKEGGFMTLGLPVVGGLSSEFANVKKAAALDHDSMAVACSAMAERVADIWQFLRSWEEKEEEAFVREMRGFVEAAGKEIEEVREEQRRVMEVVRRTTEYYQLGAAMKEKEGKPSLQLFVIVRDFLAMVDQACADISRNVQRMKKKTPLEEKEKRITTRFPNLPARFMADNLLVSRSDSEEEL